MQLDSQGGPDRPECWALLCLWLGNNLYTLIEQSLVFYDLMYYVIIYITTVLAIIVMYLD